MQLNTAHARQRSALLQALIIRPQRRDRIPRELDHIPVVERDHRDEVREVLVEAPGELLLAFGAFLCEVLGEGGETGGIREHL